VAMLLGIFRIPLALALTSALSLGLGVPLRAEEKVQVTVVAVMASSDHRKVDDRLKNLAEELKKKEPTWTGFEVERRTSYSIKLGEKDPFPLVDKCEVTVKVKGRDDDGCITLLIKPPTLGDISYSCCCGKYFPIITRYETADHKRLVVAIMVSPCTKQKK